MTSNVAFERSFADLLNGYEFSVVRPSDWHKLAKQVVPFLVADTQLYKRLCPSVSLLVRWSVGPSVPRSVRGHKSKRGKTSILDGFCVWMWGVGGGWTPLPTRPQQYCDPASLV